MKIPLVKPLGVFDINNKMIYEGDIVKCISRSDQANMVVIFEAGEFRKVLCERYKSYVTGAGYYSINSFDMIIIGNIYDNPEMISFKVK